MTTIVASYELSHTRLWDGPRNWVSKLDTVKTSQTKTKSHNHAKLILGIYNTKNHQIVRHDNRSLSSQLIYYTRTTTLIPSPPASRIEHAKHVRPTRDTSACKPFSAHQARDRSSRSFEARASRTSTDIPSFGRPAVSSCGVLRSEGAGDAYKLGLNASTLAESNTSAADITLYLYDT